MVVQGHNGLERHGAGAVRVRVEQALRLGHYDCCGCRTRRHADRQLCASGFGVQPMGRLAHALVPRADRPACRRKRHLCAYPRRHGLATGRESHGSSRHSGNQDGFVQDRILLLDVGKQGGYRQFPRDSAAACPPDGLCGVGRRCFHQPLPLRWAEYAHRARF